MKAVIILLVILAAVLGFLYYRQPDRVPKPVAPMPEPAPDARLDDLSFEHGQLHWAIRGGRRATIAHLQLGEKVLVRDNREPLLAASLLHAPEYRADSDWFPAGEEHGETMVENIAPLGDARAPTGAEVSGRIGFRSGSIRFTLRIEGRTDPEHLTATLTLSPEGNFEHRLLRDLRLQLPLALDWRKRIGQGGDRGLDWDTRYFYEFTYGTVRIAMPPQSVPHPDRNEFRLFSVDQISPLHFRIWRSESDDTSPLIHQFGRVAAGWTSAYDAEGGLLIGYRDLAEHAPKSLRIEAAGGGRVIAQLHPASQPAERIEAELLDRSIWNVTHRVDLLPFSGEAPDARPDETLATIWGRPAPLSGERPVRGLADLDDATLDEGTRPAAPTHLGPYVQGGVPLQQGALRDPAAVGLHRGATRVPVQTKPLAFWPDGSIKWLHLVFPVPPAGAAGDASSAPLLHAFQVTFRNRPDERYTLHSGMRGAPPAMEGAVRVEQAADGRVRVMNDQVALTLGTGTHWLRRLEVAGRVVHESNEGEALASIDFLRLENGYPVGNAHPRGEADDGPLEIDRIDVEETGPLRAIVRLEGRTQSREPTQVILRLKVFARRPWVEMQTSAVFAFDDPRETLVRNMSLDLPCGTLPPGALVHLGADGEAISPPGAAHISVMQESPLGGARGRVPGRDPIAAA